MSDTLDDRLAELGALGERIVQRAQAGGATVAECILRTGAELSTKVRLGFPELVEEAGHHAAGLRVMKGQHVATTSTSDLTPAGIDRFVADALELTDLSQEDPFAGPARPELLASPSDLVDLDLYDPSGGALGAARAITFATAAEASARAFDPRITNSEGATFGRAAGGAVLVLSSGFRAVTKGSYQSLSVVPVAADEGNKNRRGSHWTASRYLAALEAAELVGREAARRTLQKLGARSVGTCEVPVVFHREAARSLVGMFAGCVMGSSIWRKSSYLVGREGTRVASDAVTMVDDPLVPRGPGSRAFDGEGLRARRNVVVENGVLRMYLCDSYSGRKLGRESTGNASRGGGAGVGPGTSNFLLQPGAQSFEEILASTKQGLLVTEMMGFGFNAVTGDFSRGASGFWIESGELAFPVSEVTISLNIDELWQRIDAIGSDPDLRTSVVSPTLRVARMTVAGSG